MKQISKFFALVIVMIAFGASTFAQVGVTVTANAQATIITPIAMVKAADMNFGRISVNATPGTVVLPAAVAPVRTVTGGCTLPNPVGTVSSAAFTVSGLSGATYAITLPVGVTTLSDGVNNMTVDTWTSTPSPTGILTLGTETLYIGATLHVGGGQPANVYNSVAPFSITVNYN